MATNVIQNNLSELHLNGTDFKLKIVLVLEKTLFWTFLNMLTLFIYEILLQTIENCSDKYPIVLCLV